MRAHTRGTSRCLLAREGLSHLQPIILRLCLGTKRDLQLLNHAYLNTRFLKKAINSDRVQKKPI